MTSITSSPSKLTCLPRSGHHSWPASLVAVSVTSNTSALPGLTGTVSDRQAHSCLTFIYSTRFSCWSTTDTMMSTEATSVTLFGKDFKKGKTFSDVGVIKKSYCGSFSKTKPSVRLDFARFVKEQEEAIEKLIGTKSEYHIWAHSSSGVINKHNSEFGTWC